MGITFRHDASAVGTVPSGGGSSRKYGYDLVSQQMQQKYDSYQRGMDRWYDAAQQQAQNNFQLFRDDQQARADRKAQKRDFKLRERGRQADFERDQQAQNAARQQALLDSAREQSSRFIMDAIENGEFDTATARELQQNLISESEILGNPELDATQRAEALQKLRARREVLMSTRKPQPTPTDKANKNLRYYDEDQRRYVNPDEIQPGSRISVIDMETGIERPYVDNSPAPRMSAGEAFSQDRRIMNEYVGLAASILTNDGENPEGASDRRAVIAKAMELYEIDQEALSGGSAAGSAIPGGVTGSPTPAPTLPGQAPAETPPMASILEGGNAARSSEGNAWSEAIGGMMDEPMSPQASRKNSINIIEPPPEPTGKADDQGYIIMSDGSKAHPSDVDAARKGARPSIDRRFHPDGTPVERSPDGMKMQYEQSSGQGSGRRKADLSKPTFAAPDFKSLSSQADEADKALISGMQEIYSQKGQSPAVQDSISVFMNPNASEEDYIAAYEFLLSQGIDPESLVPPKKEKSPSPPSGTGGLGPRGLRA